ncbi:MAG TPA: LLM class flavin-dependent oxidoreductase, partial [Phenylobacterium sp.]|nr:LLM class flavin-dependent oxidoreductase [Phenylobacterium sp.]
FGAFLFMAHNWADFAATKKSYELFARHVAPRFQGLNENRVASIDWVKRNKAEFTGQMQAAVGARIVQHMVEKGTDNIRPELVEMITGQAPKAE